jgi:hypothetical protein
MGATERKSGFSRSEETSERRPRRGGGAKKRGAKKRAAKKRPSTKRPAKKQSTKKRPAKKRATKRPAKKRSPKRGARRGAKRSGGARRSRGAPRTASNLDTKINTFVPEDPTSIVLNMTERSTGIAGFLNWKDASVPHNKNKNGYRRPEKLIQIVLHETATESGKGFNAGSNTTAHFAVKRDAFVTQFNDVLERENHAGKLNSRSMGIEFVNRSWLSSNKQNGGEGIPATESALTPAQREEFAEEKGYVWAFWGMGFGIYRVPPSLDQLEKEIELLEWLTDSLAAIDDPALPRFEKTWLQLVSYDDVKAKWKFPSDRIPPDGEREERRFFFMTPGYGYSTGSLVNDVPGIIAHNGNTTSHSDGSFLALYTWLRMEKGRSPSKARALAQRLMKEHSFRVKVKSDATKRVILLDVSDETLG